MEFKFKKLMPELSNIFPSMRKNKIQTIDDLIFELSTYPGDAQIETPVKIVEKCFPGSGEICSIEIIKKKS